MIVGEGSTPVNLLTFTDGQIPIGATGADPAAANITGSSSIPGTAYGVAVLNGANSIQIGLADTLLTWIAQIGAWSLTVFPAGPGTWTEI
jgi:hypothetical protein